MNETSPHIWFLVWLAAQIAALLTIVFLFTLGLILVPFLVFFLALGNSALLAGLAAVGAANLLIKDERQTPVGVVVLRCEIAALILYVIIVAASINGSAFLPLLAVAIVLAVIVALTATHAAVTQRVSPTEVANQRRLTLLLIFVAVASIPFVIYIASLLGWAGA